MSKTDLSAGLESAVEEKKVAGAKVQTAEEVAQIEAGIEALRSIGVSPELEKIFDLALGWKGDKTELAELKKATMAAFGEGDEFKDYIAAGSFSEDYAACAGLVRLNSIFNSIKSFYTPRPGTTSKAKVLIEIGGIEYNVNKAYFTSIADKTNDEKRELLLAHADTTEAKTEVFASLN